MSEKVSIIIPCFNQGSLLSTAIESILVQSHPAFEIIVVDDGSTDNTGYIAKQFASVRYIFQDNTGLSGARNTGIKESKGDFIVFLDADDWLLPDALKINILHLRNNPDVAFVSGGHLKINSKKEITEVGKMQVDDHHYRNFLQGNYIGMIATVMFRRWVFNTYQYDVSLKACEDYDLYMNISRHYPVLHHQELIACYYFHGRNMSDNIPMMLSTVLLVLKRQQEQLADQEDRKSFLMGEYFWKHYYCMEIYNGISKSSLRNRFTSLENWRVLFKYDRPLFLKALKDSMNFGFKKIKERLTASPALAKINLGDLDRVQPFSKEFGYDRGGPVDRYYIENFLKKNNSMIKGRALEIGDNEYTMRFGGSKIEKSEILHVDEKNPKATYIGDLSDCPAVPDNIFDCIVLTQTLHLIYDWRGALKTCYRILKPGGVLLLTVPGISHIDYGEWGNTWLWAFTQKSIDRMLAEHFSKDKIQTETFGNVLVATAFLYGMGLPELSKEKLDFTDKNYQVIITAIAVK